MRKVSGFRRRSEPDRFGELMRPHFDALYAAARRMSMSAVDAEDLVQEVCLKAFLKLDELESMEYQRAWLLRVLYNQFIDSRRVLQRSPVGMATTGADENDEFEVPAASSWQPEEMLDREMRVELILKAMRLLGSDQCTLVALHDIEGMSLDELQQMTGTPIGTLKSQLHRTRAKLGRLLAKDLAHRPDLKVIGGKQ
ncbi:MAG: RNA polymerase sigma factor [Gammaproteobacteria bacterium]|nr:RNA polymerase sigma factor [Gammaproteobacteria bacterium]MDH4253398.1 RNA polymerase sigma factor [Gammaproteobacteria bacterium]MDH5310291.1 RNA polymerase sigma factor [Gammaproteobacteria bacterium]